MIPVIQILARLNIGGPAVYTILLTKLLDPSRYATTLVTGTVSPSEGDMSYLADEQGVTPLFIPELGREIRWQDDLIAFWKIFRLLRKIRPAIVHTHTAKAGMLGRLAAKLAGVPILVHTFHGHVFHSYFSPRKTQMFLAIERFLARFTDVIITLSPKQREEILGYGIGNPDNVRAIGLGLQLQPFVDCAGLRGGLRRELGVNEDAPLIGIIARLVPVKGHLYFLEAAQIVLRAFPNARFLIVGDGELRPELERQADALGIRRSVDFLGFRRDLAQIYADLDVVALSSLNEGLPVTLIEGMAAGKPVAASNVGGVGDLVQHGQSGLLTPPKDSRALAEGICDLLRRSPEERRRMGEIGRARVYPKYHITTLAQQIETVYESLLNRHGRPSASA